MTAYEYIQQVLQNTQKSFLQNVRGKLLSKADAMLLEDLKLKVEFSKTHPNELSEEYCKDLFKSYGAFYPVINPLVKVMGQVDEAIFIIDSCSLCDQIQPCQLSMASRYPTRIFNVCNFCMSDFNMHIFNSDMIEYCRLQKPKRIS